MKKRYTLSISGKMHETLRKHLLPDDQKEAVAIALCGRFESKNEIRLLIHEIHPIPYEECSRKSNLLHWKTDSLISLLQKANNHSFSVMKIHSHPNGGRFFSATDKESDNRLFPSIFGWIDDAPIHASCIMLPSGEVFGKVFTVDMNSIPIETVKYVGEEIKFWSQANFDSSVFSEEFNIRNEQAFGKGTVNTLSKLKVAVVGCSGTGSIVIEQLVRLGVGELLLFDLDIMEKKNLNRILNSKMEDALSKRKKTDVLKQAIDQIGIGTKVSSFPYDIYSKVDYLKELASSDVIFGCVDSIDARHLLNQISTFFIIPYFDIGVKLISDKKGGISHIVGTIHYLQPGGSSLLSRNVYTTEELRSALNKKTDPEYYEEQKKLKYISDVEVESPAVISVNMQASSMSINEFLARLHGFREEEISNFAIVRFDIINGYIQNEGDGESDKYLQKYVGRGLNISPFLNMPEFE